VSAPEGDERQVERAVLEEVIGLHPPTHAALRFAALLNAS
jgi:hypothetical protein